MPREIFLVYDFFCGESESVSEQPVSPDVWDVAKEVYSYLAPSRILRYDAQLGRREGIGRIATRAFRGFQRNTNVTNCFMSSLGEAYLRGSGE